MKKIFKDHLASKPVTVPAVKQSNSRSKVYNSFSTAPVKCDEQPRALFSKGAAFMLID